MSVIDINMKTELFNFVCRVCLRNEEQNYEKLFSLFESCNDSSISTKINSIADVNIQEGDGLPDRICPDCLLQLENAVAFKHKCESSDNILNNTTVWKYKQNICELLLKKEYEQNSSEIPDSKDSAVDTDTSLVENVETFKIKLEEDEVEKDTCHGSEVICHDCSGTFKSKCKLRVHWRKIHQPDYLTCLSCKRMFTTYKAFNNHQKNPPMSCTSVVKAKIEGKGKSRIFNCPHCHYKTKYAKTIQYHMSVHTGGALRCDKCPKVFIQHASLISHKESQHNEYTIEVACEYCGIIIRGRRKLYAHLLRHKRKDTKVSCNMCNKMFKNSRSLKYHMKRHGSIKAFSCALCTESFYTSSDLSCHKRKVHLKKKFTCDECGYSLNTITALKQHKPKHTPTNAVCLTCGTFVESEEKLILHQKLHTERKYPCPLCEKKFYTAKSRSKHVNKKHMTSMLALNKKLST